MTPLQALKPGDVLTTRGSGLTGILIRLGAALLDKPNITNHVAVMHHWNGGVPWGLEGKPGGVGWVDLRGYAASRWTMNNCAQPGRGDGTRAQVAADAERMIGTAYDWAAIADDTLRSFRMPELFTRTRSGVTAGQVVCSSYAAFLYKRAGWAHPPADERDCEPADWAAFIIEGGFSMPLR